MNDSLWTFVFEIANFVALAAVLAWLFFKPVRKTIEDQRAKAKRKEEEATQKLADAERCRQEIESQRNRLARELEAMRVRAREVAKQEAEQIVGKARAQMERERATLKREAVYIEQAETVRLAHAVTAATHHTMRRFFEQIAGPDLEQTLMQAGCRQLQTFSDQALGRVTVESATPLDEESQQTIRSCLGHSARTADFRVVPELQGGLRITTARGLIDASIAGLASFAQQSLTTEMESMMREASQDA